MLFSETEPGYKLDLGPREIWKHHNIKWMTEKWIHIHLPLVILNAELTYKLTGSLWHPVQEEAIETDEFMGPQQKSKRQTPQNFQCDLG